MEDECIFYAETNDNGYAFKVLMDCMADFYSRIDMSISNTGIEISKTDPPLMTTSHHVVLKRDGFGVYKCKYTEQTPLKITIDLRLLQRLLKNTKKKESIILYMKNAKKFTLRLRQESSKSNLNTRCEELTVKTQKLEESDEVQEYPGPECYCDPMVIQSTDYQKIKKLNRDGTLKICMEQDNYLAIIDTDATYESKIYFGEQKEGDMYQWEAVFDKETIKKTAKITGLSTKIQFCCPSKNDQDSFPYPLLIKVNVGELGSLRIFIRDKTTVDKEKQSNEGLLSY
jgi:Proliferating cell nuclear antigen, N-terminal domain